MKSIILGLFLLASTNSYGAKGDGWCDARNKVLACASPYWVTTGQYFINNDMHKSVSDLLDNTFIECWWVRDRARVIRRENYRNFRVGQERWSLYEVEHKGYHAYIVSGVCR